MDEMGVDIRGNLCFKHSTYQFVSIPCFNHLLSGTNPHHA